MTQSLSIAMIGQRGVPATFGGVEHHVEALGSRMVERGHRVTVFCRPNYTDKQEGTTYRGMDLRYVPTISTKHLDAVLPSGLAALGSLGRGFDVVHFHALGPGIFSPLPRYLSGAAVAQTIHGLDSERQKWGRGAQMLLKAAERLSAKVPNETIVVSRTLAEYYQERYNRRTVYIPNGVDPHAAPPATHVTDRFGLEPGKYVLFVGRFVPEKAPDVLIKAFRQIPGDVRLVLAGGSSYTTDFHEELVRMAGEDDRVLLPGYVFGDDLWALYAHAGVFVNPSYLEGLPLTVLEAASFKVPLIVSDIGPHREVVPISEPGHVVVQPGDVDGLQEAIEKTLALADEAKADAEVLGDSVLAEYNWDRATTMTLEVYESIAR